MRVIPLFADKSHISGATGYGLLAPFFLAIHCLRSFLCLARKRCIGVMKRHGFLYPRASRGRRLAEPSGQHEREQSAIQFLRAGQGFDGEIHSSSIQVFVNPKTL